MREGPGRPTIFDAFWRDATLWVARFGNRGTALWLVFSRYRPVYRRLDPVEARLATPSRPGSACRPINQGGALAGRNNDQLRGAIAVGIVGRGPRSARIRLKTINVSGMRHGPALPQEGSERRLSVESRLERGSKHQIFAISGEDRVAVWLPVQGHSPNRKNACQSDIRKARRDRLA